MTSTDFLRAKFDESVSEIYYYYYLNWAKISGQMNNYILNNKKLFNYILWSCNGVDGDYEVDRPSIRIKIYTEQT